jgi:predicted DNA-binding transcriptional regulator AlpA
MTEQNLLKLRDVLKMFPVSKTTWYAGIRDGRYPKSVKIGKKAVAWLKQDIEKCIENIKSEQ